MGTRHPARGGGPGNRDRLDRVERALGARTDDDGRFTFHIVAPPPGLTAEEHALWSAEQRREAEAQGAFYFTMNLGTADVRCDGPDEPCDVREDV
jgi:hypothetical protein